ncbi:hypothetical protein [Dictyobacter aurantiacus]|uniref:Uncharacterized protein n=1 Tax=Dictyobacter aurantiacus TaxID=1936993 RepID=A0A401ZH61_9CHLR|nr:hypothetical protein [Dictyobacter aurantiacus]GCE06133.1 hypothetical protein KDAU_34620 [Dictyobacter aurantiacus]
MVERPYSRYTRAKTWAALYSQHIHAGYALVPHTTTENSIDVINCKDGNKSGLDLARETLQKAEELLKHEREIAEYYRLRQTPDKAPAVIADAIKAKKLRTAVVLAKSSEYYHYSLEDIPGLTLVICGLHDSYLHIPVWEMNTNRRYKARETAVSLTDPYFDVIRCTQFGHSILLAAYAKGNADAIAFVESKQFPERSRTRMKREKDAFQHQTYRGRPLAFRDEAARREVGQKISQSLKEYHAKKHLRIL